MGRIIPALPAVLLALVWTAVASAAGNLQFGPPAQWVQPTALPDAGPATQAGIKVLLVDHQISLTPGTVKYYVESAMRIQTPQGLTAVGTVTLAWDPDTDVLTVHKVHIIRDGKVIDVLGAGGQTFTTARREANLDYAALDDTLTAILQPADLRVGDTVDVAYTLERTDPVLAGTAEAVPEVSPLVPIRLLHISASWPRSQAIKWQAQGLTGVRQTHDGNLSGIDATMRDVQPIQEPKYAPLRYQVGRRIELTSFGSWEQVGARLAPLYTRAAVLKPQSPLTAEIARIRAATPDPAARAGMALALVEDQVRYVFLGMNDGGLIPADADQTWSRRFGDCKAKTVLLLALLHGLGIEAEPVAVNVQAGGGMDARLPMIQLFDHVLVRAVIGGQTYWLDGTRIGDKGLAHLHVPYYHWGLPLIASGAPLVKLVPPPLTLPSLQTAVSIDASKGVGAPAPFHVETDVRDDGGLGMSQRLANLTPAQLDTGLRAFWRKQYDFVEVKSVSAAYDEQAGLERLSMDGTAQLEWRGGQYEPPDLGLGYDADFERQPGPNADAPYAVPYPVYMSTRLTIRLPAGGKGFSVTGDDVDRTLAGVAYQRHARISGAVFTAEATSRTLMTEFPASEAAGDQKALRDLSKAAVDIDAPTGHTPTAAEIAWGVPATASTAGDYAKAAYFLLQHNEYAAADEDLSAALALDSNYSWALAVRGLSRERQGDTAGAQGDFTAALASDPSDSVALEGRGWLAMVSGDSAGAIAAFSDAIRINPKDVYALRSRAMVYEGQGKSDQALQDLDATIKLTPQELTLYRMRAVVLEQLGRRTDALAQADLAIAVAPKAPVPYLTAGGIYLGCHDQARAAAAFDQAVKITPSAWVYIARAAYRPWSDLSGRRADIESALKIQPKSPRALAMLAEVQMASGQYSEAVASLTSSMDGRGGESGILAERGIAYQKSGQAALAQADFAKARASAKLPGELNNLCWELATADVALPSALDDCNAALAKSPMLTPALDSRGFVLMRLGRYDQAIASYDSALRLDPLETDSLYGRGVCELRTGKEDRGHADIRAATALSYAVADEFAHYGVQP